MERGGKLGVSGRGGVGPLQCSWVAPSNANPDFLPVRTLGDAMIPCGTASRLSVWSSLKVERGEVVVSTARFSLPQVSSSLHPSTLHQWTATGSLQQLALGSLQGLVVQFDKCTGEGKHGRLLKLIFDDGACPKCRGYGGGCQEQWLPVGVTSAER